MKKVIGIATSDWHFWHTPPVWRSAEENWLETMGKYLDIIISEAYKFNCDIFMAGDMFDHYNPVPQTINFVKNKLKNQIYAVPGQHDLEHHILENLDKTGFETLSDKIIYYPKQDYYNFNGLNVYFAPWGTDFSSIKVRKFAGVKNILIAHKYVWFDDKTRYGGPDIPTGKLTGLKEILQRFDFAIFGDNHIPFTCKIGNCNVINPGTMVKRKIDEKDYKTGYALLYDDNTFDFIEFDTSGDKHLDIQVEETPSIDFDSSSFVTQLQSMEINEIDFQEEIEKKLKTMNRQDMNKEFTDIFNKYQENKK